MFEIERITKLDLRLNASCDPSCEPDDYTSTCSPDYGDDPDYNPDEYFQKAFVKRLRKCKNVCN